MTSGGPIPEVPDEVGAIRAEIERALNIEDADGRAVGTAKFGVYAFFDYDEEPIYVGQTRERLSSRIRRHLTNQRTDAVAMSVLDPFEVCYIEMWPFFEFEGRTTSDPDVVETLAAAEYTVYQLALEGSTFNAVLNEKDMPEAVPIQLPPSYRARIIPDDIYARRRHPDIRIARRAQTIASLAKVISERQVSKGLRRTLVTQASRLEHLARRRHAGVIGDVPREAPGEETGEEAANDSM